MGSRRDVMTVMHSPALKMEEAEKGKQLSMDCSPPGSSVHGTGDSPGKNTGVGWPCLPPEDLPDPGIEPASPVSPALAGRFSLLSHLGSPSFCCTTS